MFLLLFLRIQTVGSHSEALAVQTMSSRMSVKMQGKSAGSSLSRSLQASRLARQARKSVKRSAAAPSILRSGGFSFTSTGGKELNFVDTVLSSAAVSTTPVISLLNGMAQGTTASTRIGRRIAMKSIEFKFRVLSDTTTTATVTRFAIVLDKQANAAAPAFTDIYDSADPGALRNISNKARFWVLWDSGLSPLIGNTATAGQQTDSSLKVFENYKRINIPVQYNAGTAGTVGDIQTNALYFVSIGSTVSGTSDAILSGNFRVRYDDS